MAARLTKAQVAQVYKDRGIMQPTVRLTEEELERHLRQRSIRYDNAKAKAARSRAAARRKAISDS